MLSGIELYAFGGVSSAERAVGQRYKIDVELGVDLTLAAQSDAIENTVHYGLVHDTVVTTVRERQFNLLESVAARVADRLLAEFEVEWVFVRFAKLLPPIDGVIASAAVELRRQRGSLSQGNDEARTNQSK